MTCNHVANVFCSLMPDGLAVFLYAVGGVTFPIMCFLLVEGYRHTSDLRKYATRLALFALISQVPYSLLWGPTPNVLWTLLIALGVLWAYDNLKPRWAFWLVLALAYFGTATFDWGSIGVVMALLFYLITNSPSVSNRFIQNRFTQNDFIQNASGENASGSGFFTHDDSGENNSETGGFDPLASGPESFGAEERSQAYAGAFNSAVFGKAGLALVMLIPFAATLFDPVTALFGLASSGIPIWAELLAMFDFDASTSALFLSYSDPGLHILQAGFFAANFAIIGYATLGFGAATALLSSYNGRRGRPIKFFFYAFYPAHLFVIWILSLFL